MAAPTSAKPVEPPRQKATVKILIVRPLRRGTRIRLGRLTTKLPPVKERR